MYIQHQFEGFERRIQNEYNQSPIGPYEGPFDQNPKVPIFAQLLHSRLSYEDYTSVLHPKNFKSKVLKTKDNVEDIDNLEKIDMLEIIEDSANVFIEPDNTEKVFYTCCKKFCVIPCVCNLCTSDDGQCRNDKLKHMDLFDETDDMFSVRSTDLHCSKSNFFMHSYILKYPGIPKSCGKCENDLLNPKCYHLKFHRSCKFCKLYQYKLYPNSTKELYKREVKEKFWYKSVCPHCDKKFIEPYQRDRHIRLEHMNNKLKCNECAKSYQCKESLQYHILSIKAHTKCCRITM